MVGRLLNYLLVPLHTAVFLPAQYGIVTEMYAYVAFLIVLLTYGMETAFFRLNSLEEDKTKTFKTALTSLLLTTSLFIGIASLFAQPIADVLRYPNNQEYVIWFALIVGLDAISSIPLAKLRAQNKPWRFMVVNLGNVVVNIALNLFFLAYCLPKYNAGDTNWLIDTFYNPEIGVGYVFISNLIASIAKFLLLAPTMQLFSLGLDRALLKKMLLYGSPLLIAGLAGMANETIDRILLKWMLLPEGEEYAMEQVGIYGACYKLSIIITLFLQAFRYAAEPFFFAQEKEKGSGDTYATIMTWFVVVCMAIFLLVTLFIDQFKYFISNEAFWVGLPVVPILLMANVFLGIYYNQSVWYKLSDNTRFGAYIALIGAAITLVLNFLLIPIMGYMGSAWTTLVCYFVMMLVSYFMGRKHYPIPYNLPRIALYVFLGLGLWYLSTWLPTMGIVLKFLVGTLLLSVFLLIFVLLEKPLATFRKQ